MINFHYKNLPVFINGSAIFAEGISVQSNNRVATDRFLTNKVSYFVEGGIETSVSISYYITYDNEPEEPDLFYGKLLNNEPFEIYIGGNGTTNKGVYLAKSYVRSLSISGNEHGVVIGVATISAFEEIKGNLLYLALGGNFENDLSPKEISLYKYSGFNNSLGLGMIRSFNFAASSSLTPYYSLDSNEPTHIGFKEKTRSMRLNGYGLASFVKFNGGNDLTTITLSLTGHTNPIKTYSVSGKIKSSSLSVNPDEIISGDIEVEEQF